MIDCLWVVIELKGHTDGSPGANHGCGLKQDGRVTGKRVTVTQPPATVT